MSYELLAQIIDLIQRDGRVTYRALKRRFDLDEEYLADLTAEIIEAKRLAVDEDGKVLVWVGNTAEDKEERITDKGIKKYTETQDPSRWTPAHLAERIRAVSLTDSERKTLIYIPSIVLAELYYVNVKYRQPLLFAQEYERLTESGQFRFVESAQQTYYALTPWLPSQKCMTA